MVPVEKRTIHLVGRPDPWPPSCPEGKGARCRGRASHPCLSLLSMSSLSLSSLKSLLSQPSGAPSARHDGADVRLR